VPIPRPSALELDFVERDGYQIGKGAALVEWAAKKEAGAFKKFCGRLYQRNWARKRRQEQPERVRGNLNRWRRANGESIRAQERARRAKKRRPIICTCKGCGKPFQTRRPRAAKWCTKACSNRYWTKHRKSRNRGIRNMQIGPMVFAVLQAEPGLTLRELHARLPGVKRGSLATKLTVWFQEGVVVREKGRYRLPPPTP
jgi:hypothetical protein